MGWYTVVMKSFKWVNPVLRPLVQSLISNPNKTYQQFHLHHNVLQVPLQPNVLRNETLFSHFEIKTPWTVGLPVPLYCTPGPGPTSPDLMVRQVLAKYNYKRELTSVHRSYKLIETHRTRPDLDLREVEEDPTVKNSAAVIYAGLLDRDPDPYLLLESGYDYHFTGGSMATIVAPEGSRTLATVFAACGGNLEEVNIIQLDHLGSEVPNKIEAKKSANYLSEDAGPVLEITADPGGRCVLIRKRHTIVVLRNVPSGRQENDEELSTMSSDDTEWRATQRIRSKVPFASVCMVNFGFLVRRTISICTVDYRRHIRLWQIDRKADPVEKCTKKLPRNEGRLEKKTEEIRKEDNWAAVRCVDGRSLVACLNRHQIHLYSIREETDSCVDCSDSDEEVESPNATFVLRGSSSISQWTMACERASALEVAPSERLIFIATCHKIIVANVESLECDKASSSSSSSINDESMLRVNVLIVFAHNLQQRPAFMSHVAYAGSDETDEESGHQHFLLVGSHLPMSYGVCSFTKSCIKGSASEKPQYYTRHLPLHPPTFHDAYRKAQASGHCLSTHEPLKRRFYACQSGMVLLPANGNGGEEEDGYPHIILLTSGGDLLHQKIVTKRPEQDSSSASDLTRSRIGHSNVTEELHHWHEKLLLDESIKPKPYKATDFRTLKRFRDIFNCTHDPNELKDIVFRPPTKKWSRGQREKQADLSAQMCREPSPTRSISSVSDTSLSASAAGDYVSARATVSNGPRQRPEPLAWRQTIEELQEYKDVLAPGMLAVWGYGGPVGGTFAQGFPEQIPTKLPPYQNVNERVGSWVAKTTSAEQFGLGRADEHMSEIQDEIPYDEFGLQPWQEPKNANKVELPNQFQRLRDEQLMEVISQNDTASLSRAVFEVQAEPKPSTTTRPAKKKYVKGF
ncbi:uncharacterized protein LOC131289406 [Anopheles ziemanni]|uniref:uncharacterized protein LOC131289406 n=1 Tax=Anopheles ziemanni TaxID=345580 RepID=UPI00265F88E5|nr:uncharacterized protein LOC131289406 [Anopheles ziemanni]